MSDRYVIWSHEHQAWWRPGRQGYARRFADAGLYSRDIAIAICTGALPGSREVPNELPIRLEDLEEMRRRSEGLSKLLDPE